MKRTFFRFFLGSCLLIWSGAVLAQTSGPPAAPPPVEPPSVQTPSPPVMQPAPPPAPAVAPPVATPKSVGPRRFYNPGTVETLAGEVVDVQRGPVRQGGKGNVVRFHLKTDKETILVFLGPAKFVDNLPVKLAAGDKVQVKGSRITGPKGRTSITAAEVTKGGQVMKLRDDNGTPLWPKKQGKKPRPLKTS